MSKYDIYKMVEQSRYDEALKALNHIYFTLKTMSEKTYDEIFDAIHDARMEAER